jgi:hypothetical protein
MPLLSPRRIGVSCLMHLIGGYRRPTLGSSVRFNRSQKRDPALFRVHTNEFVRPATRYESLQEKTREGCGEILRAGLVSSREAHERAVAEGAIGRGGRAYEAGVRCRRDSQQRSKRAAFVGATPGPIGTIP